MILAPIPNNDKTKQLTVCAAMTHTNERQKKREYTQTQTTRPTHHVLCLLFRLQSFINVFSFGLGNKLRVFQTNVGNLRL